MNREQQIAKLAKEISIRVQKLKKLGCVYEDKASSVVLFDNTLTHIPLPEDRYIGSLESGIESGFRRE